MKNRIAHVAVMSLVLTAVVPGEVVAQQQRSYDRFKDRTSYEAKVELSKLSKTSRGISLSLQSVVDGGRASHGAESARSRATKGREDGADGQQPSKGGAAGLLASGPCPEQKGNALLDGPSGAQCPCLAGCPPARSWKDKSGEAAASAAAPAWLDE